MKKISLLAVLALSLTAFVAVGATQFSRIFNLQVQGKTLLGTGVESGNAITKSLGGSATIDFASLTTTCADSSAITVTGAVAGDACFVGPPAAAQANLSFTCYVSAADSVKVRACAAGTAADAASATYYVRVFSAQ